MNPTLQAYFLVGPTAVGKSAVAQWLAEREGFDILSADSMLVYTDMDIGTAKPSVADRQRVACHGLDLVTPDQTYSVWRYWRYAVDVLRHNAERGQRTIVVGGTGLYVKSLTDGLAESAAPDLLRRARWQALLSEKGVAALQAELLALDPAAPARLEDAQNPRRLMRALERALSRAPTVAPWRRKEAGAPLAGLHMETATLNSRIAKRVHEMYRQGLVEEVRKLRTAYDLFAGTAAHAIGYAEAMECVEGRLGEADAIERTAARTRRLAKRQRTWFRRQANVEWIDVGPGDSVEGVAGAVLGLWKKHGPTTVVSGGDLNGER